MKAFFRSVFLIAILATGCSPETTPPIATPIPSTSTPIPSTPTSIPSTPTPASTPTESFILLTSQENLVGTWYCKKTGFRRINEDGTINYADVPNGLNRPFTIQQFWFEGGYLMIKEVYLDPSLPSCNTNGTYEVRLYEGGDIQLRIVEDKCVLRARDTAGRYSSVP